MVSGINSAFDTAVYAMLQSSARMNNIASNIAGQHENGKDMVIEFTNMIKEQANFQANANVAMTVDEMYRELLSI